MNESSRSHIVRGLVVAGAIGMMLSLGCPSGEPSGGSGGSCSGGSVTMIQMNSGHDCPASEKPTISMTGSTLSCPLKSPASPIMVSCSGSPGAYQNCKFDEFDFTGLSLLSPTTFAGEFVCGTETARPAVFTPNEVTATASPDPLQQIDVEFTM